MLIRPERWLRLAAISPLLLVAAHKWAYPSDGVGGHLFVATIQALVFLGVIRLSNALTGVPKKVSRGDRIIGLVATGLAGFGATIFLLLFGEDGGTLDDLGHAFLANPPSWWWPVAHSWLEWLLATLGLLVSSVAIRRGSAIGYFGLAITLSLIALLHWAHHEDGYNASIESVYVVSSVSVFCWLVAAYRLIVSPANVTPTELKPET